MLFKTINLHIFHLKGTVPVKKPEMAETFFTGRVSVCSSKCFTVAFPSSLMFSDGNKTGICYQGSTEISNQGWYVYIMV